MAQVNSKELENYANYILNNDQRDVLVDLITMKIVNSFRRGSEAEREKCGLLMDSLELFFTELQRITDNSGAINTTEEE